MKTRPSLTEATRKYSNRYTMEHRPNWANEPCGNGKFYAPQYESDAEWYANAVFPGEPGHTGDRHHCQSNNQTWPMGRWLETNKKE